MHKMKTNLTNKRKKAHRKLRLARTLAVIRALID